MEITIRTMDQSDVQAITEILKEPGLFARIASEAPSETRTHIARQLALCLSDDSHLLMVAEQAGGEVVGYISVHWLPYLIHAGPEGYISELFIRTSARGQGVGSRLLEKVEAEAAQRGCVRLSLLNMRTRESYQREFYIKQGWEQRSEAANFVKALQGK